MGGCHTPTRHGHPPPEGGWHHCGHWRDGETCCACGQTPDTPQGTDVDTDGLAEIRHAHQGRESTHWEGCHLAHAECAVQVLAGEVEQWRDAVREHRDEIHEASGNLLMIGDSNEHLWALLGEGNR